MDGGGQFLFSNLFRYLSWTLSIGFGTQKNTKKNILKNCHFFSRTPYLWWGVKNCMCWQSWNVGRPGSLQEPPWEKRTQVWLLEYFQAWFWISRGSWPIHDRLGPLLLHQQEARYANAAKVGISGVDKPFLVPFTNGKGILSFDPTNLLSHQICTSALLAIFWLGNRRWKEIQTAVTSTHLKPLNDHLQ